MGTDLYNLGPVVDRLAPALMGMAPGDDHGTEREFRQGEPVVRVVGDRATGKTALIDTLYAGYHDFVPTARVYLTEPPYSAADPVDRAALDTDTASAVTNLLFTLSHELKKMGNRQTHAVDFPRLAPALLVLTAWRPQAPDAGSVHPSEREAAEQELRDLLTEQDPDPEARKEALGRWLQVLNGVATDLLTGVPGIGAVLQVATDALLDRAADDPQWTWWRARLDQGRGDAVQRLFELVQQFRARGPGRAAVESHLIAALLADIHESYGFWARRSQHPALILLDDVDEALHRRFLDPLVAQYAAAAGQWHRRGRIMLPVVFATSLGDGAAPESKTTDGTPWTHPERCPPQSWLLNLGIPRVTGGEIRGMLSGAAAPPALPEVVARLGGGRTGSALLIARTAAERLRDAEPFALDELLSLPVPESSVPLGARLLEQLLPDPDVRDQLLTLAPALDEAAAARLFLSSRAAGLPVVSPTLRVRQLLDSPVRLSHWNHDPWPGPEPRPLIADRALRAVLLHELRGASEGLRWSHAHTALADHYNPGDVRESDSDRHDPRHLHHALAQGRFDSLVVRAMHHRYLTYAPAVWLRDLNLIAAAPPALGPWPPDEPPDGTELPACPSCTDAAARRIHFLIRQLLAVVWRLSAPLSAPPQGHRDRDMEKVRGSLTELCTDYDLHPRPPVKPCNAYVDALAAGGWIDALVNGVQAPDLPVKER
ncbi:hypothetical protein ACIBKX_23270 [Streptomyces sp. NPDC050658]|uniref:hypothetical protein n=1 Tax=unclassified Streptomyces TaxID=2593676 RepID=UPI0034220400